MCGIVAVLPREATRAVPEPRAILNPLVAAHVALTKEPALDHLVTAADALAAVDALLRGTPGVTLLVRNASVASEVAVIAGDCDQAVNALEQSLDAGTNPIDAPLEAVNAQLVRLKDALWAIKRDRLRTAEAVAALAGPAPSASAIAAYHSLQIALSAIDRLEVRGRDSAGIHVLVDRHGLDVSDPAVASLIAERSDALFTACSVRVPDGRLSIVYKAAAEIGELGDNTRALREQIAKDELLRTAVAHDGATVTVLGHTRWASVGIISEANAHPLNSEETGAAGDRGSPYVVGALNGDVDNYLELRRAERLRIPHEVTTDAKVIPTLVSRQCGAGLALTDAFRQTVASFDGSVAIGASASAEPDRVFLALRGSGQALYIGLAEDAFVVASEPYGLVEQTARYVRMDGETPGPDGRNGQVVVIDRAAAGTLDGVTRLAYGGAALPLSENDVQTAEITTRDIDRAEFSHFLIKEVSESPKSVRKTLRGKLVFDGDTPHVTLPEESLPAAIRQRLANGGIRRIIGIGQGTAHIAAGGLAAALEAELTGTPITVEATPATELSGFRLRDDMSDTLVIAISQSGTTTDTNRTVDMARSRGAAVIAIVNRRNSDLVEKSDGVLYTSDGRDMEMAVPSTKAFYMQIAAGILLAAGIADAAGAGDRGRRTELLRGLSQLPDAMEQVLELREQAAVAARRLAPYRRYWAIVGNGPNRVAAAEVRIKLSELCYKSIACDTTEDKKHIDLSAEPLILVCAAGLDGATADDVAKEIAIYRAHKAAPIVIASEGERRYAAALDVIEVPRVHPQLDFVLSAMVGHLFGYEAALAIDAQARFLREARAAVDEVVASGLSPEGMLQMLGALLDPFSRRFFDELRSGAFNGNLEAATAVRIATLLRYATGALTLDGYSVDFGRPGSPAAVVEDLDAALTQGIDELTRPVDAIKHQAKTVTVGISRAEDDLLDNPLAQEVLAAGTPREDLTYRTLRTLVAMSPAVRAVTGLTRYEVKGSVAEGNATIHVIDKRGIATELASRTDRDPTLRGTKHRAAEQRYVTVARGGGDGRTVLIVPEVRDNRVSGITLLHVEFEEHVTPAVARRMLSAYWDDRYAALVDAVTEREPEFNDEVLATIPAFDLLVQPVHVLAQHWRPSS
jgi:glucosamine--fructose-6-phosphate aminotransferase (isomerizing)